MKLFFEAIFKVILGVILVALLLFLPAGTFIYKRAWILLGILFIPMIIAGSIMLIKNPELLRKRLDAKESEKEQKSVILLSGIMFILGFVLAGISYRFNLLMLPYWVSYAGVALFLISYILYAKVLMDNPYLSRTIKVMDEQVVVDKGFYSIVRHPMYSVTLILFLSMPIILGSALSLIVFLLYPYIIIKRLLNEEKLLIKELPGYEEYIKKVRYRLIPYIW